MWKFLSSIFLIVGSFYHEERVDLIELNHFYDDRGKPVFTQYIIYEWNDGHAEYHVRNFLMEEKILFFKNHFAGLYTIILPETRVQVKITSQNFKESWTQIDPERINKKKLDENLRVKIPYTSPYYNPELIISPIEQ